MLRLNRTVVTANAVDNRQAFGNNDGDTPPPLAAHPLDTCTVPRTRTRFGDRGVFPLPAPGSGTACRRNCDCQTLSLANSVDH